MLVKGQDSNLFEISEFEFVEAKFPNVKKSPRSQKWDQEHIKKIQKGYREYATSN